MYTSNWNTSCNNQKNIYVIFLSKFYCFRTKDNETRYLKQIYFNWNLNCGPFLENLGVIVSPASLKIGQEKDGHRRRPCKCHVFWSPSRVSGTACGRVLLFYANNCSRGTISPFRASCFGHKVSTCKITLVQRCIFSPFLEAHQSQSQICPRCSIHATFVCELRPFCSQTV